MSLEESFIKYKNVTLTIMEIVKSEQYEKLDEFFSQRQLILEDINKLNCSKEQLKEFYVKYNIENLHRTLEEEIKNRKDDLLAKIRQSQKRKVAVSGYNNLQAKAVFLSKEL